MMSYPRPRRGMQVVLRAKERKLGLMAHDGYRMSSRAGIANFTCLDVELIRYQTDHDMQHDGDAWTDTINLRLTANLTAGG